MAIPDKSLAISYQFNGDRFRNAIRFVFEMETDADQQIMFHFTDVVHFVGPSDGDAVPFNPAEAITRTTHAPVTAPCDVEFVQTSDVSTAFGVVIPTKLQVTLLDEDYETIKDATFATIGGERYIRDYERPSSALFDVALHIITFVAENER
jgi:hypothetical protein